MSDIGRERDLVLNPNEYAYVLDRTKGIISCVVGPYKMSLSDSDALVEFNPETKRFEKTNYENAVATYVTAPENWYIALKNPAKEGDEHPVAGSANVTPKLDVGKKININGNVSFALYPGQMAKVIQGHRLHSNQYLLARVYDADALNAQMGECADSNKNPNSAEETDTQAVNTGTEAENGTSCIPVSDSTPTALRRPYITGQILVIKGEDCPFYIPPTGIEVIAVGGRGNQYVRDAVTLEKLEYCILKNEKGAKKFIYGDAVVFPQPDEVFVRNTDAADDESKYKFHAFELSETSGIYVKVISDYEENGASHKAGEELFITGRDQMFYYPRQEHAIIDYNGQAVHHAIAVPAGEGRYVLNRKTGNVSLLKGPAMYLPDPRNEVIVQRRLSLKQCKLWYPGNEDAVEFNLGIDENTGCREEHRTVPKRRAAYDGGISRSNEYTKPRTIVIDNKYNGAVSVDVFTGFAVNVVSKSGKRHVVVGPATYLLEYDETLESFELSTGKPKTTDLTIEDVYLRVSNNKISDIINVQTKDFVELGVKVSYCVDFLDEYKDKWFAVDNYVKYMTDRQRSLLKMEAKKHTIEEFSENAAEIVRKILLDEGNSKSGCHGRLFKENGMLVKDVEVLSVEIKSSEAAAIINDYQRQMVERSIELSNANKSAEIAVKKAEADKLKAEVDNEARLYKIDLDTKLEKDRIEKEQAVEKIRAASVKAGKEAEQALQPLLDEIQKAELAREKARTDMDIAKRREMDAIAAAKQKAYTESVKKIMESVSPDLVAALTANANADILESVSKSMSPYAIAGGESVADVTNRLLRGTPLEGLFEAGMKKLQETMSDDTEY